MWSFEEVIEGRIRDAIARGELDDLPGSGMRLALDDDALVPVELRLAHRILRNAGYVPEEVWLRREMGELERSLDTLDEQRARIQAVQRLDLLRARLAARRGREEPMRLGAEYEHRVLHRLRRRCRS